MKARLLDLLLGPAIAIAFAIVFMGIGKLSAADRPVVTVAAQAKAKRAAMTVWPALSQREIDATTARAKGAGAGSVKIFCFDEVKCGDLASSLENAFESARWKVEVRYTAAMIPPGMLASDQVRGLLVIGPQFGLQADPEPDGSETITIGERR